MKTLKKKINKINKEHSLLTIEEIMRLMEEFYDKYDGDFEIPSIDFYFENGDCLKMYREIDCSALGWPLWYIKLSCTNNVTWESWETAPMLVWEDAYTIIKECIGHNIITSKIEHIGLVL